MQQAQTLLQHIGQHLTGGLRFRWRSVIEPHFGRFDVPIAIFVPHKLIQLATSFAQLPAFDQAARFALHRLQPAQDPAIRQPQLVGRRQLIAHVIGRVILRQRQRVIGQVHDHKASGVPDLVGKVAIGFNARHTQLHVTARCAASEQGEAQGVAAILGDQVERVEGVAQTLAHLAPLFVAHQAMQIDIAERHVAGKLQAHHDHTRHPEEDDVIARLQDCGRVEAFQIIGLRRPAQRTKGPETAAKPGVQHIGVLL